METRFFAQFSAEKKTVKNPRMSTVFEDRDEGCALTRDNVLRSAGYLRAEIESYLLNVTCDAVEGGQWRS